MKQQRPDRPAEVVAVFPLRRHRAASDESAAWADPERFELHMALQRKVGELLEEANAMGVPVTEYPIDSLYNVRSLQARLRLARYLREHSIEMVHSYGFYSNLFAIPRAPGPAFPWLSHPFAIAERR